MKAKAALIVLVLALAACGGEPADPETAAAETENEESIIEPMTHAIDDAKAVEDQLMQQKEEVDAALDQAEKAADDE